MNGCNAGPGMDEYKVVAIIAGQLLINTPQPLEPPQITTAVTEARAILKEARDRDYPPTPPTS